MVGIRCHPTVTPLCRTTFRRADIPPPPPVLPMVAHAGAAHDGAAFARSADGGSTYDGSAYDGPTYATTLVCTSPFLPTRGDLQILL
jgi:hypothetical protein